MDMTTKYAFIFPGQGSQQVGMGKELSARWQVARATFEEANDTLGFDLAHLCFSGSQQQLTATEYAQPAILTTSVATLRVLLDMGIEPAIAAGHSVGSFAALVAADSLTFADAVRIVRQRGLLMSAVRQHGTMLAVISANADRLAEAEQIARTEFDIDVAGYNSLTQTVFSGDATQIQRLQERLTNLSGVQAKNLSVSHAFHSRLMAEQQSAWQDYLQSCPVRTARIPVGLNVTGIFSTDRQQIITDLVDQFTHAVQWRALYGQLVAQSYDVLIEVGMGRTLSGLARAWKGTPAPITTEGAAAIMRLRKTLSSPVTVDMTSAA
jgi:[acyl-carrier-protein] S-malonyltransferase